MKRGNCNLYAWRELVSGRADIIALTQTAHSYYGEHASRWWWRYLLRPVGLLLAFTAWMLMQVAWFLTFGRWAHSMVVEKGTGAVLEYAPETDKILKRFPPVIYGGVIYRVAKWHTVPRTTV